MKHFFGAIAFVFFLSHPLFSQIGGVGVYKFMNLSPNSRSTALGGNIIGINDKDLGAAFQNPALLSPNMHNSIGFSQVNYLSDINYGYVAIAKHLENVGTMAFGIQYVNYGNFEARDPSANNMGSFNAGDYLLHVSYATKYEGNVSYGINLKGIYSHLESYNSVGIAADAGLNYFNPENNFSSSFVVKNMGAQLKPYTDGNSEPLPFEIQAGLSKKLDKAPFRYSIVLHNLQKYDLSYLDPEEQNREIDLSTGEPIKTKFSRADLIGRHIIFGVEAIFSKNFILRVGYNQQKRKELSIAERRSTSGFSWGFEIGIKKIHFSYGNQVFGLSGASNQFSILLNLSDFKSKPKTAN